MLGPLHQSEAAAAHAYRQRDLFSFASEVVCVSFLWGAFLSPLGLNALCCREYDGFSGLTAAQLTVLGGLHDRV